MMFCCCGQGCDILEDGFNRDDEDFFIGFLDSSGLWMTLQGTEWGIFGVELQAAVSSTDPTHVVALNYAPPFPRQFNVNVFVDFTDPGYAELEYFWQHEGGGEGRALRVQLECTSVVPGACGILRLFAIEYAGGVESVITQLGYDYWIVGVVPQTDILLTLCYSAEKGLAVVRVTPAGYPMQSAHAFYATPEGTALDLATIRLRVPPPATGTTFVNFDDFSLAKGYTAGDLGYGDRERCQCCDGGCDGAGDDFADSSIDCRWTQAQGSWSEGAGFIETDNTGAHQLIWQGGFNGLGINCEYDNSLRASARFKPSEDLTTDPFVFLDYVDGNNYHSISVAPDTGIATLAKVTSGSGSTLETIDPETGALDPEQEYTLTICMRNGQFWFRWGGQVKSVESVPHGGDRWGIGVGRNNGSLRFIDAVANRNIHKTECSDCFSDNDEPGQGLDCEHCVDGEAPQGLTAIIESVGGAEDSDHMCDPRDILSFCDETSNYDEEDLETEERASCSLVNGSWLLERSHNSVCGCHWKPYGFIDVRASGNCAGVLCVENTMAIETLQDWLAKNKSWERVLRKVYHEDELVCKISYSIGQIDFNIFPKGTQYRSVWVAHLIRSTVCFVPDGVSSGDYCARQTTFLFAKIQDYETLELAKKRCMFIGTAQDDEEEEDPDDEVQEIVLTPCFISNVDVPFEEPHNNPNNPSGTPCYDLACMRWDEEDPFIYCDPRESVIRIRVA